MLLWVREAAAVVETGDVYGPGLTALGLSPDNCIVVEARSLVDALRAALEGARCTALSAVILETVAAIDLTASRRLKLAAEKSGVEIVLIRHGGRIAPNAAQIRWRVQGVPQLKQDGPRRAAFDVFVLKSSSGVDERSCIVEWDHERRCFAQTVSVPLDAVPVVGSLAA
jgi:protein ImuA